MAAVDEVWNFIENVCNPVILDLEVATLGLDAVSPSTGHVRVCDTREFGKDLFTNSDLTSGNHLFQRLKHVPLVGSWHD